MPVKFLEKLPFFDWPVPSMPAAPFQGCHALGRGDFFASPLAGRWPQRDRRGAPFYIGFRPGGCVTF